MIRRSTKWFPVVYTALIGFACLVVFAGGYEAGQGNPTVRTVVSKRSPISASASLAQVEANFAGKPYAHGAIAELPGFICDGYTNGANGHGWTVLRCSK